MSHIDFMATKESTVRARVEPELKEETEKIFTEMGISTTDAIRMFLNQVRIHKGFPYPLVAPGSPMDVQDILHPTDRRSSTLDLFDED